jgi:nucleolar complex protein 3
VCIFTLDTNYPPSPSNTLYTQQTETLKLLFVLYFRILKSQTPTPLLSAALRGISRYAHQVNIDFFKDLMNVLKDLVARTPEDDDDDDGVNAETTASTHAPHAEDVRCRLECIVTAFELLTGQGKLTLCSRLPFSR